MRNFSFIGLLLTIALIGWMAKGYLAPAVSHDVNDKTTVEYWVAHTSERATMMSYCQSHPQEQNGSECQLAMAAQLKIDTESGHSGQATTSQGTGQGADQNTGQASDELQAQQDSNALDPGGQ